MKKVVGRTGIEDALARLDWLTQEEARMAAAQGLKATHEVDHKVKSVDDHIQQVDDRVQGISSHVQQVDDKVQGVDDKVQGVDDKVQQVTYDIGDQKRSSLSTSSGWQGWLNCSHRGSATEGPQKLARSPGSICKL